MGCVSSPRGAGPPAVPAADGGYPAADGGYPAADGGCPAADGGTPAADGGAPARGAGGPPRRAGHPPSGGGGPAAHGGYPPTVAALPAGRIRAPPVAGRRHGSSGVGLASARGGEEDVVQDEPVARRVAEQRQVRRRVADVVLVVLGVVAAVEGEEALPGGPVEVAHRARHGRLPEDDDARLDRRGAEGRRLPHEPADAGDVVLREHRRDGVDARGEVEQREVVGERRCGAPAAAARRCRRASTGTR